MCKTILCCLLFVAMVCAVAYGENFSARDFQCDPQAKNSETAVLVDQDTEEEWVVAKGDQINGWLVAEITPQYIGLLQYQDDEPYPILNRIYYNSKTFHDAPDTDQ